MAQFCEDIKCKFYDTFPDGQKFPFCPFCSNPLVAEKPSLSEVTDPQPVDQTIEREESLVEIESCPNVISNDFITPIYNLGATRHEKHLESRHDIKFEDVIVTFSTAVLKKHYLQSNRCISLRFKSSSIGEFKFERIEFKGFRLMNYEGIEFVLLEETVKINKSVLTGLKHSEQLLIPYKYYFFDSEEKLYLNEGDCYRNLVIDWFAFTEWNTIQKFDMIVLPNVLASEEYYLKQIDNRLSVHFNIYSNDLLNLPVRSLKNAIQTILFSLYSDYYSKISTVKKRKNFQVYDSKKQIYEESSKILYIWLKVLMMNTFLPFHTKILLSFFSFEEELLQPHSSELFILLFQGVNNGFILSLINSRCDVFSDYISEIKSRPYLLHHAMQGISSKDFSQLVKFLPLYHFLFDSKENFSIAQSNNAFLDNAYWGLPSDVKFQYYDDVDISVIRDAMSIFHTTDPLLPYSIILLALRSDIFLDLLEIRSIPYLPFFSVLLYRVKTWSLIQQDCKLRELVFTTFLGKSEQTPGLMNGDEICQACDVIFRMLDVIKDSPVTLLDKLNLEQVKGILHALAKLLELFVEKYPTFLSLQHFDRAKSIVISLKTAPVLLSTIRSCLFEDVLQPNFQFEYTLFEEVTNIWNGLCCIPFPQGYDWKSGVCKQLSKRLSEQTLESILITFVQICNHYNELNNDSIFSCFRNEILEKLSTSRTIVKDQKTAVEFIVQVSKEQFYLVADIIAAILASNLSKLNENPVKHILTLPWWSRVVKFCKPNKFTKSHPVAENIMELVKSTFSNISLQYHMLTIKTKDLTIILDNQDNYFSMLQSMPEGDSRILKQLDRVLFNDSIQHRKMLRDTFIEFRALMHDLKKLLDSTNSQIRSQELSQFWDFDFENSSISTLSRISEEKKICIIPDWEHSKIANNSMFNLMLRTLQDLLKSQYFLSTYKQKVEELKEFEKSLKELYLLYIGAFDTVQNTIKDLFDMKILISTVYTHFYIDTAIDSDLFEREIDHLVSAIEILYQQPCYNKENKAEIVRRVKLCFELKQRQKFTETILEVKDKFCIEGNFDSIYVLNALSDEKKDLQSLTQEMFDISNKLIQFTDLHQRILDSLLICVDLFQWTSRILKNENDLDNLRELALNSSDGSSFEVNSISSFYTLCRLYSPFIYGFNQEINQETFLLKLSAVHCNIESHGDVRYKLPEIYKECASEANIEFWKTLEIKHTSTGGNTISQLNQIMSGGMFLLNVKESSCNVEDIISVQITQNYKIKTYFLNELKEMQSETVLISPEMHQDSVGARFQHLLKLILSLSEIVLKFHKSGDVLFRNKKLAYSCDSTDILSEDISFLEEKYKNWINDFEQARQKCYFLNFFTSSQILTIQIGQERLGRVPSKVIEKQAFYLLTILSEDLSEEEVRAAFNRVYRRSSSVCSSISSIDSVTSNELESSTRISQLSSLGTSYLDVSISEPTNENRFHGPSIVTFPENELELDESPTIHISKSELMRMYQDQPEYISLTKLEKFFGIFSQRSIQQKRDFLLTVSEPNLIFIPNHLMMDSILSLYYTSKQLPYPHEVLICSEKTTLEEIEIFWRRSLNNASNAFIFCLASIEKLNYDVAVKSVSSLKGFLNSASSNESEFRLVLICSEEHKHSSYMASALVRYERILTEKQNLENLKSFVFQNISASKDFSSKKTEHFPVKPASIVDQDECYVRIVSSESHGNGKSLWIKRWVEALKKESKSEDPHLIPCTIVSLYESKGCEDKATDKLLASPVSADEYGRIYHFDIICSSDKQILSFLFKLLIMRTICDSSGRIYRCSKNNYYVIEANMSTLTPELMHFFELFPVWKCLGPNEVLRSEKGKRGPKIEEIMTLRDLSEFRSEAFQRVFAYLEKLESRANIDRYIYTNDPNRKSENRLDILLKYYGQDNPSWSEVKHFISFFNKQLIACEGNIYCQSFKLNKNWSGFKQFLVDCMVLMSKDFITPSLRNSLQSPPPDAVAGYDIDENRKWGQKNYPNIFINEDLQSMTFFGISISQDLSKLDGFDSNKIIAEKVISQQLYNLLKKNEVNLEEDFHNWDRHKMLSILVNVLGVPSNSSDAPPDPDPNYVLTVDNVKKILAIHMRFRSNIPVILMGDTGCGKTRLIQFMCKLQARNPDLHNLVILKVHGEITENDIKKSYKNAVDLAERNSLKNIDTILFFDEANTSYSIGLIKEILCDSRVDGVSIPKGLRLQFVVACNPYQRHSDKMLTKLTSAGLGMLASNDQVREHFIDIPLRELVYRVLPLPNSLLPLVWDFGNLTPESEKSYIYNIVVTNLKHYTSEQLVSYSEVISDTFYHSQMYMRKRRDECSFVSLRDVERTVRVMLWFYQWLPNLQISNMTLDLITYSLILALAVCYRAKLRERKEFDEYVISNVEHLRNRISEIYDLTKEVEKFQDVVVSMMNIGEHIAINRALKENLFMMFVCIQLKIPLFIIGKPGTSKSLAKYIISHSMNGDLNIHGKKVAGIQFTQVSMESYQCSQLTTSEEIRSLFRKCTTIQAQNDPSCVACVVLDEVGLAEDSPNLPLKILHSLLEDGMDSEGQGPGVAFIGLSNWALDPAKMNRGIMLHLEDPTAEELVNTAHSIIKPCGEKHDNYSQTLSPYIKSLAEGYLKLVKPSLATSSKDYFGLRDFYHIIKLLYILCKRFDNLLTKSMISYSIKRNFGGITDINIIEIFNQYLNIPDSEDDIGPLSDPLSLITSSLESKSHEDPYFRSRYLLLLTDDYVALDILFNSHILNEDTKVMFGSTFPLDQEYFSICHNLNRIKIFMETGKTVVLTNLSNVYEILYEMLNQFYVELFGRSWVDIGIGSRRIKCAVHPDFRLIVIADKSTVFEKFPPPLINRLEKHILTISTIIEDDVVMTNIVSKLTEWLRRFNTVHINIQNDTLPFMVYSTINKFELKGGELEWEEHILKVVKFELLKIVTPISILRLLKSDLTSEATDVFQNYCRFKLYSLVDYLQEIPNIRNYFNEQYRSISFDIQLSSDESNSVLQLKFDSKACKDIPYLSFVTTHSILLTETDISEIANNLTEHFEMKPDISLFNLSQFRSEKEFILSINQNISIKLRDKERKIIIIQCEENTGNSDLISCAKYRLVEIVNENNCNLNSNFYFILIIKLVLTEPGSGCSSFCGEPWDSVYIDELRKSHHYLLPPFDQITQLSVAQIFDYHYQDIPVCFPLIFFISLIIC